MNFRMARWGKRIFFSRRHNCVRRSVVFLVSNFLLIAACVFTAEVLLIMLGIRGVYLPLTGDTISFLSHALF